MSLVEVKNFNALIHNKSFFDELVKNKQEVYEKLIKMSRNDEKLYNRKLINYFSCHQNSYKFIAFGLSRQTNVSIPQQINFIENLEEDNGATMFFIAEKQ